MATMISTKTVKRLRTAIMVCPKDGDHWFRLSAGTWLRKIEGTGSPAYNPEHNSFDLYRVMDGDRQGEEVYRTGKSIEDFLQVDEPMVTQNL